MSTVIRRNLSASTRRKMIWETVRGFITRHRLLSTILGTISLGVLGGISKVFGQYFAEEALAWITMRF
ncbi:hypothetical protein SALBM135S_09598 [Streptomyces alboniger]